MKAYAQALELKDDPALIAEYKTYHKHVWPEVKQALRDIGITSMRIYLVGTRLFMHLEAPESFDPERDFQKFADTKRGAAWDRLMRQFQERIPGAKVGEWWTPMELVFDLDW